MGREQTMKTISIIGGMSWESSAEYYRQINQAIRAKLGPTHSAELLMYSMDFHPIALLEQDERWDELAQYLIGAVARLERAGADFVILASNTVHKVADAVQRSIHLPLIHIADATAEEIGKAGIAKVGLLGTRLVMEQQFYSERFRSFGIEVVIPDRAGRSYVHNVIYNELIVGKLLPESRQHMQEIILDLEQAGAQAVVLACTELPLLIRAEDTPVKLFDTMAIHARKAVALATQTGIREE